MNRPIRYLSVCSGIEAASVAWEPLGWQAAAFAEIEPFPCRVLAARQGASRPMFLPDPLAVEDRRERRRRAGVIARMAELPETARVPNFGDLTRFKEWPDAAFDVLVGGTPCQSFSVAGLRKGLDDPRGNLALVYLAVADRYRPDWLLWENVPGVLSSGNGRDFGAFLGALGELGYGWAYRVLDAQFVRTRRIPGAVPQRRRRVFVVGYLGDWRPPAAVLFDAESLRGNPPPRRIAGQGPAPTLASRPSGGGGLGTDFELDVGLVHKSAAADDGTGHDAFGRRLDLPGVRGGEQPGLGNSVRVVQPRQHSGLISNAIGGDVARALTAGHSAAGRMDVTRDNFVAHALRGEGFDASEDGTGRGTPIVAVTGPLTAGMGKSAARMPHEQGALVPVAIQERASCENPNAGPDGAGFRQDGAAYTLEARTVPQAVALPWSVRRLTPTECERLQGFPDGYTDVPKPGAKSTPDGARYKALGNSMAVNVMAWLGERIALVDAIRRGVG